MGEHDVTPAEAEDLVQEYELLAEKLLSGNRRLASAPGWESALEVVTLAMTVKALCTSRSILLLVRGGFLREAQILLRVLVELVVKLLAIGMKPKRRAELYVHFQHISKWRWYQNAQRNATLKAHLEATDQGLGKELEREFERHSPAYLGRNGKPRRNWHAERLADLADEVGMKDLWDAMYPLDSAFVHSGPDCLGQYLHWSQDGTAELGEHMTPASTLRVLHDAATCLSRTIGHVLGVFPSPEGERELEQLDRRRDELFDP